MPCRESCARNLALQLVSIHGPQHEKNLLNFRNGPEHFFDISPIFEVFDMKYMRNPEKKTEKFKLFFRGFLAPLRII